MRSLDIQIATAYSKLREIILEELSRSIKNTEAILKKTVLFKKTGFIILGALLLLALPATILLSPSFNKTLKKTILTSKTADSQCTQGTAYGNTQYNTASAPVGGHICGSDGFIYDCAAPGGWQGWQQRASSFDCRTAQQECKCTGGGEKDNPNPVTKNCGESICGVTNNHEWKCASNNNWQDTGQAGICSTGGAGGGVPGCNAAPRPGQGDCQYGDIIDNATGNDFCSTPNSYTGYKGQQVCGKNKQNYICKDGNWIIDPSRPGTCGPGGSQTCKNDGITSVLCGSICYCVGGGDSTCNHSYGTSACPANQKKICSGNQPGGCGTGNQLSGTCEDVSKQLGFASYAAACKSHNNMCPAPQGDHCYCDVCGGGTNPNPTGGTQPRPTGATNPNPTNTTNPNPTSGTQPNPTVNIIDPTTAVNPTAPVATTNPTQPNPTNATPGITVSPTPAPSPVTTAVDVAIAIPGVGPGQNTTPVSAVRTTQIEFYSSTNQKIGETSEDLRFDNSVSAFTETIFPNLITGTYKVRLRVNNSLWKAVKNLKITAGEDFTIPKTKLITGDLNQDNQLNLLDYTAMISAIQASAPTPTTGTLGSKTTVSSHATASTPMSAADLNMDGEVDEVDLNILYAQFQARSGD